MKRFSVEAIRKFDEFLIAETDSIDEAIKIARDEWDSLSPGDKDDSDIEVRDHNFLDYYGNYDLVIWWKPDTMNDLRNADEIRDALKEIIIQFDIDRHPYASKVYLYVDKDRNGELYVDEFGGYFPAHEYKMIYEYASDCLLSDFWTTREELAYAVGKTVDELNREIYPEDPDCVGAREYWEYVDSKYHDELEAEYRAIINEEWFDGIVDSLMRDVL